MTLVNGVRWPLVCARVEKGNPRFLPATKAHGFDPAQRLIILKKLLPGGIPNKSLDPVAVTGAFGHQLALFMSKSSRAANVHHMLGIQKKGMSFLRELATGWSLPDHFLMDDSQVPDIDIRSKSVLVVDDSIHYGRAFRRVVGSLKKAEAKSVTFATAVASQETIAILRQEFPDVPLYAMFEVPDAEFFLHYQQIFVPMLNACRGGAIPNRPAKCVTVSAARFDPDDSAVDTLQALCGLGITERVVELPPLDGIVGQIFHGTIELNAQTFAELNSKLGGDAEIDQAKIRVYIDHTDGLRLHLYGIIWLLAKESLAPAAVETYEKQLAAELLKHAYDGLKTALLDKGYTLS